MLNAAMRLNIPAVFVSGGPMEAGKVVLHGKTVALDLVDAMVAAADDKISDEDVKIIERSACPTCGSCSGMFTANSMNCLTEALGLSLPGNGSTLATHSDRKRLFVEAGHLIVDLARRYYEQDDETVLPRTIANKAAFENAMSLDIAMGGSTNTVLHILAAAHEGGVDFGMEDIDRLSRRFPAFQRSRLPSGTCTWKTFTTPAASCAFSASWIAAVSSIAIPTRCTRRRWATPSTVGTSPAPTAKPCGSSSRLPRRRADAGGLQPVVALGRSGYGR